MKRKLIDLLPEYKGFHADMTYDENEDCISFEIFGKKMRKRIFAVVYDDEDYYEKFHELVDKYVLEGENK